MPNFELSDEEKQLTETAREFTRKEIIPVAGAARRARRVPATRSEEGLGDRPHELRDPRGLRRPGLSCLDALPDQEEIAYGCTRRQHVAGGNSLGAMPLIIAGTDEQKKKYLGALAGEPIFAAYCCSRARRRLRRRRHAARASTKARRRLRPQRPEALDHQRRRRQLLHRVRDARSRRLKHKGITCFVVDARHARASRSARKRTRWASARSNTTDVIFEDVKVAARRRSSAARARASRSR